MMKAFYFIIWFFFFAGSIFPQEKNIVIIKGNVFCARDNKPVANAIVVLKADDGTIRSVKTDSAGKYEVKANTSAATKAKVYAETDKYIRCPGEGTSFLATEQTYQLDLKDSVPALCNFALTPVDNCGRLPQFLFKKNSTEPFVYYEKNSFSPDSILISEESEAGWLYKTLADNPTIILEISGHCSAEEKMPDKLSQARADKIKKLLVKKGIAERRLVSKGYGIKKLKISKEMLAKAKTSEEREALAQKNRRCVFRVLSWDYLEKNEEGK